MSVLVLFNPSAGNRYTIISNYAEDAETMSVVDALKELELLPEYTADDGEKLEADLRGVRRELEREAAATTFYWRLLTSCGCSATEREVSCSEEVMRRSYLMLAGERPLRECELHRKCQMHFKAVQDAALFERLLKGMEVVASGLPVSAKVRQLHEQFASSGKEEAMSKADRVEMLKQATTREELKKVLAVRVRE